MFDFYHCRTPFCKLSPLGLHFDPGMPAKDDSTLPFVLLGAGWLLGVLGLWGAFWRWWIWPLGLGAGLLVAGAVALFASVQLARKAPSP